MSYFKATGLGTTASCGGATKAMYTWNSKGECIDRRTGIAYQGHQGNSNCQCLYGDPPKGAAGLWSYLKDQYFTGTVPLVGGRQESDITVPRVVLPAAIAIGGVALFLITRKKK